MAGDATSPPAFQYQPTKPRSSRAKYRLPTEAWIAKGRVIVRDAVDFVSRQPASWLALIRHPTHHRLRAKGETHAHQRKYDVCTSHRGQEGAACSQSDLHPRVNPADQEEDDPRPAEHGKILVIAEVQDDLQLLAYWSGPQHDHISASTDRVFHQVLRNS